MESIIKEIIETVQEKYWKPYEELEKEIKSKLCNNGILVDFIFYTGELTNVYVYIKIKNTLYIYNKNSDEKNAFLAKNYGIKNIIFTDKIAVINDFVYSLSNNIVEITLINMCVIDNFPIPRLNLSTGAIAAYIRRYQKARVKIIDMQLRITIDEIMEELNIDRPQLIGISISFGQKNLSDKLIKEIELNKNLKKSKIIVGNVIPSLYSKEYLKEHPNIIVSYREGEESFLDLIDYILGRKKIEEVRGISYINSKGCYQRNAIDLLDINNLPFPAIDTVEGVIKYKGALTLELSRGCNYSKCTFCPRAHKGAIWRALSVDTMVIYFKTLEDVCNKLNKIPFFYIADEEFIGQLPHDYELNRIEEFCEKVKKLNIKVKFDISARVDSIFKENVTKQENIEQLKMWMLLKKIGLQRLFLGVESGCNNQLKRFNKGTTSYQNATAIQLITALGINIRIGYITFDPLMENFDDIIESHKFVERKDILYSEIDYDNVTLEDLYDTIVEKKQTKKQSIKLQNNPLYFKVSYPLTSLEVLFATAYELKVKEYEKKYNVKMLKEIDINMARYRTEYYNERVGKVSDFCQRWIDYNFPVLYSLKGLYKTSYGETKNKIYELMTVSKSIDHYLLNYILLQLSEVKSDQALNDFSSSYNFKITKLYGSDEEILKQALNLWQNIESVFINKIVILMKEKIIKDTNDFALTRAIENWNKKRKTWNKIN